jgi:hypothetical protein
MVRKFRRPLIVVLSNDLKIELENRLASSRAQATVMTFHVALTFRDSDLVIVDEVYALANFVVDRLAALAPRSYGFGDPKQIMDTGAGVYEDFFNPKCPILTTTVSHTIPHDVLALGIRTCMADSSTTTTSNVHESLSLCPTNVRELFPDALYICFVRDCCKPHRTAQTVQGIRTEIAVVHLCGREEIFLNTPFLWTALTRASTHTFLDFDPFALDFLDIQPPTLSPASLADLQQSLRKV